MLLLKLSSIHKKHVYSKLQHTGISSGQPKVLDYLSSFDGCVQKDLANACEIEPATVTNLLAKMESQGLIKRKAPDGNRRSLNVFLTEEGKTANEKVSKVFEELENISFNGFSEEEKDLFISMLSKVYKNILEIDK